MNSRVHYTEFNKTQKLFHKLFGLNLIINNCYEFTWGYIAWDAPGRDLGFVINRGGYFGSNYEIVLDIWKFCLKVKLPIKTKLPKGCNNPRYGFYVNNGILFLWFGGEYDHRIGQCIGIKDRSLSYEIPWFAWEFDNFQFIDNTGVWRTTEKSAIIGDAKKAYVETHNFEYNSNGTIQKSKARCMIESRTWKRKWFPWIRKTAISVNVEFNEEIGAGSGSWKGGIISLSEPLGPGETISDCLERLKRRKL